MSFFSFGFNRSVRMLGRENVQRSFFDASLAVEKLLDPGSFYDVLQRNGHRLLSEEDFLDCYDPTNGRPSVPPSRMFKLLLLQQYEDLSDRQALERMSFDLRWKAVLGLEVQDRAVGQATLVEFRARMQVHGKMEQAFGRFLERAVEGGLIAADAVQVIDSTAIWGRGAVQDTYNLMGAAVRKLLGAVARRKGRGADALASELGLVLTSPGEGSVKGRADIDWSDPLARRGFLNRLVSEARVLLGVLEQETEPDPDVAEAAALLRRILVQDLEPVTSAVPEREPAHAPSSEQAVLALDTEVQIHDGVAPDRVISVGDPEMRHGHKSEHQIWEGYKAHVSVAAETEIITGIHITPANVADAHAAPAVLESQPTHGLRPSVLVGDMAYSAAELRTSAAAQGTEIVARVPAARNTSGCYTKDAFRIDLEAQSVTCPTGHTTYHSAALRNGARRFHFDGQLCAACPLRTQCTRLALEQMQRTGRGRTITLHPREDVLQHARQQQSTARVKQLLKLRLVVERRIAHLVGRGLRQARYVGGRKVLFQALTTALVVNLVRTAPLALL